MEQLVTFPEGQGSEQAQLCCWKPQWHWKGSSWELILLSNVVLSVFWCSTESAPREHRVEFIRLQDHPELGPGESLGQRVRSERLQSEYFHGAFMISQVRSGEFLQNQSQACVREHIFLQLPPAEFCSCLPWKLPKGCSWLLNCR